jgi:hypothetical protein
VADNALANVNWISCTPPLELVWVELNVWAVTEPGNLSAIPKKAVALKVLSVQPAAKAETVPPPLWKARMRLLADVGVIAPPANVTVAVEMLF